MKRMSATLSVHHAARISGSPWLDRAAAGESFLAERGRWRRCRTGEVVVRDAKGIVASAAGAAARTAFSASSASPATARSPGAIGLLLLMPEDCVLSQADAVARELVAELAGCGHARLTTLAG